MKNKLGKPFTQAELTKIKKAVKDMDLQALENIIVDNSTQETTYGKVYHTNYGGSWKVEVDPTTHKPYKWYQRLWNWVKSNY